LRRADVEGGRRFENGDAGRRRHPGGTLLVVLMPYLALAAKARRFLRSPRALKAPNRMAATFMMGAAAAIAIRQ
jgi:hypothetical protein